jgi:YHS domain-containing protein
VKDSAGSSGPKVLDPVCDMIVAVDDAREQGLTLAMPDREYAFCSQGCMTTFAKAPQRFRAKVDAWVVANPQS